MSQTVTTGGDDEDWDSTTGLVPKQFTLWRVKWETKTSLSTRIDSDASHLFSDTAEAINSGPGDSGHHRGLHSKSNDEEEVNFNGGSREIGPDNDPDDAVLIQEFRKTLNHCLENSQPINVVLLEVNSLKHAYNISLEDLAFYIVKALLLMSSTNEKENAKTFALAFKNLLTHFAPVLQKYVSNSESCASYCLQAVEDQACYQPVVMDAVEWLIHCLYDQDVTTEAVIRDWVASSPLLFDEDLTEGCKQVRDNIKGFLKWLDEAEEEDDEEE